jgi:phage shock protein A/DNA-binding transcriptional regulator YiaG
MSRRLEMTEEVRAWLEDLRRREPSAAREVGVAVTVLLDEGPGLHPPLMVAAEAARRDLDPGDALDHSYQQQLLALQNVRRGVADAATVSKRLDLQLRQLEEQSSRLAEQVEKAGEMGRTDLVGEGEIRRAAVEAQLGELRRLRDENVREEERLALQVRRLQTRVDGFRVRKEIVKAAYSAAQARVAVEEMLGEDDSDANADLAEARATVEALRAEARDIEERVRSLPGETERSQDRGTSELRLATLTGHDVRILVAVEPGDTALLLAARDGAGGWWKWYDLALGEARSLLSERDLLAVKTDSDEMTVWHSYTREAFLDAFFPDATVKEMTAAAERLLARNRVHPLVEVRRRSGLSRTQLAERMNVDAARVTAIEEGDPGATGIRDLAAYLGALGGRLEVVAEVAGERIVIA